jgi:ferritin
MALIELSKGGLNMLNNTIQDAFNKQLNAELFSSYLYLSMSAYFESQNLKGMAHWMRIQGQEELQHAMKFFGFINERGGRVLLTQVDGPKTEWSSPLDAFEDTYEHECKVTGLINGLVDLSLSEKDHAANTFLQWFVTEQVEEEASAQEIRDKLKLVGDSPAVLFMLDQELGQRMPPAAPTAQA